MAKHGKKYQAVLEKVELDKEYSAREAVALVKETSITKFDATVEVHLRTALIRVRPTNKFVMLLSCRMDWARP